MPPYFTLPPHSLVKPLVPFLWIFTLQLHLHRLVMQWEKKKKMPQLSFRKFSCQSARSKRTLEDDEKVSIYFLFNIDKWGMASSETYMGFSGFLITWPWSLLNFHMKSVLRAATDEPQCWKIAQKSLIFSFLFWIFTRRVWNFKKYETFGV